jgi:hypothetical protein
MRIWLGFLAVLAAALVGCGSSDFGPDMVKGILEGAPVTLAGEQVTLTDAQVRCGVENDLWDPPSGNIARLTQKGRDLKFSDDIRVADPEINVPYTQVNGAFPVQVADVLKVRDENAGKVVELRLGVVIGHECFSRPLPVMGIHKGKFTTDAPVVFSFTGSGKEWSLDKLMH